MRNLKTEIITKKVSSVCREINYTIDKQIVEKINYLLKGEKSPIAKEILQMMLKNFEIAENEKKPICQDTGSVVVFADVGQKINIVGTSFEKAIQKGVKDGYKYLRKSIVENPIFGRINSGTNTPCTIHTTLIEGDELFLTICAKGAGAENKSRIKMFDPTVGIDKIAEFIVQTVLRAGSTACPPTIVGVGIGGNFETCAVLSKKALLSPINQKNTDPKLADLEKRFLEKINTLYIGPQGFGGNTTALAVKILTQSTHIASLPVAVNLSCYLSRPFFIFSFEVA